VDTTFAFYSGVFLCHYWLLFGLGYMVLLSCSFSPGKIVNQSLSLSSAAAAQGCQFTPPPQEHLALNLEFWRCVLCRGFVERGALLSLLLPCVNLVQLKFFLSCSFSSSTTELLCHLSKKSTRFPQVLFFRVWHLTSFQHFLFSLQD
jgi:hypothetical protein